MYSVVDFRDCGEKFVVKAAWCEGMCSAKVKNRGNRSSILRTIFFSPSPSDTPNFSLPILPCFNSTKIACYKGYVLKTFGKYLNSIFLCYF